MQPITVTYATHPTRKGDRALLADVFLPDGDGVTDLLVWMHSGGFRSGTRSHRNHARIAAEFSRHGIASAFIDYRLARPAAILLPGTEAKLDALVAEAEHAGEEMHVTYYGPRPLAVVEDCCAFLAYAQARADRWRLSGQYLVGGSSAGAVSALNTLYLPQTLGLARPSIATVLAYSGGFAFPVCLAPTGTRILAQACPTDARMPISSIRRTHGLLSGPDADTIVLIEHAEYEHGELRLTATEPLSDAVDRAVTFHRADDPLDISVDIPGAKVRRAC